MSSSSSKFPADRNVVGSSGGDVAAEVSKICFANDFIFSFAYLPTHFSSTTCIPFQVTHRTATSNSEAPADHSASAADGANASEKVRHLLKEL